MDNFSQEQEVEKDAFLQEGADIEFDENIDIDAIQKALQAQLGEGYADSEAPNPDVAEVKQEDFSSQEQTESKLDENNSEVNEKPLDPVSQEEINIGSIIQNAPSAVDPKAKKYVIYVDPDNIAYIEDLSIDERKLVINRVLREQKELSVATIEAKRRNKFIRHIGLVIVTCLVFFPILFLLVNKSLEVSMVNYNQAEKNIVKLYKKQGKIKPKAEINLD